LTHSRLWDAVVGFLHVFAHMMMKLAQVQAAYLNTYCTHLSPYKTPPAAFRNHK
jgi:hypothetical protein